MQHAFSMNLPKSRAILAKLLTVCAERPGAAHARGHESAYVETKGERQRGHAAMRVDRLSRHTACVSVAHSEGAPGIFQEQFLFEQFLLQCDALPRKVHPSSTVPSSVPTRKVHTLQRRAAPICRDNAAWEARL